MPPRHTKPLYVEEVVTMASGEERKLGEVSVGDFVITHAGRRRRVNAVHEQGSLDLVDVRLANGASVLAAPDHPFLTRNGWIKAADLAGHDVAITPVEQRTGGDTDLFALAGYLIGDGSIGWCRNGRAQKSSIICADSEELGHLTQICDRLGITLREGAGKYEWHLSGGYARGAVNQRAGGTAWRRTQEFSIREWLRENDMVHSSAEKRIPEFVMRGTSDQIAAYLGAYFACDGTVANRAGRHKGVNFTFTTISEQLAQETQRLLFRLGISFNLRRIKTQVVYKGERKIGVGWQVATAASGEAKRFFDIIGPHIVHAKRQRMERELAAIKIYPANDGYISVKSVTPGGRGECRCLEVEEDRSFVCGGMVVHNSEFASYLFPAWYLGQYPNRKIIQASNTAELAQGFGRKVRNLLQSDPAFREVFPEVKLRADSTAAGRWNTNKGGDYYAVGVDGDVAGRGADLFVIDDPHGETEALAAEAGDHSVYDKTYQWYGLVRQRLQPGAAIVQVATRWSQRDLTAMLLKADEERGHQENWEVIELPAILPSGKQLWPEFWPLKELEVLRDGGIPIHRWSAQYQQNPTSGAASLIKREWWREWKERTPPKVEFLIQSWDTAFSMSNRADFSACSTWGVFTAAGAGGREYPQLILLDSFKERMEFPTLKQKAYELYRKYEPDTCIIEASAAGTPLIYELRAMGLPVVDYVPGRRTNDKILRANSVSDLFSAGSVWYMPTPFNMMMIDEFAEFPVGEHDDMVDSATQALIRYRQGGAIRLPSDEKDDAETAQRRAKSLYYRVT